jgi:acetylornithine aminotransferase
VGCTVLDIIEQQGLLNNAAGQGERLLVRLREALHGHPDVMGVRGLGLMVGIELNRPIRDLCLKAAQDHGVLINVTRGQTIRLLPPLIIDEADVEMIVGGVVGALE